MNLKKLSWIRNKLKRYLKDKEILDIILFGSLIKGKAMPEDIDIAVITEKPLKIEIPDFHVSILSPRDFFINPPMIVNTLIREGYSLKNNKLFSEIYKFESRVLFIYQLKDLKPSLRVKIVNQLRGKKNEKGLVEENKGKWLANQVFTVPIGNEYIFQKLFINFEVKFNKSYILIH